MQISQKQNKVAEAIRGRQKKLIILAGALGTSKTFGVAALIISLAKQYPGSVIGVGRKNTSEMKRGTMMSFDEAARKMGVIDFKENRQELTWKFENGSKILFFEIDRSHDRDFSKIKSMNLTCAFIDEADAVQKEGMLALYGRVGRANENGAPDFLILACNPNEAWIKEDFYDKHKIDALPHDVEFIEFDMTDSFLPQSYYAKFDSSPNNWKQRFLYNNWSYGDDDSSMFKYALLDRAHINVLEDGVHYAALDVARFGTDRSVAALWHGRQLVDVTILKDKEDKITNTALAMLFRDYCINNEVGYENACVDAVGNGSGVVDYLHDKGFYVKEFLAGGKADGNYNNKRSESTHQLAQDIEKGDVKLFDSCPYLSELKKELTMQNYEIKDKVLKIESKDKIKERLGMSPDIADAVIMAYSLQLQTDMIGLDDFSL
jgi:PBSX family phage terminase large subunit